MKSMYARIASQGLPRPDARDNYRTAATAASASASTSAQISTSVVVNIQEERSTTELRTVA